MAWCRGGRWSISCWPLVGVSPESNGGQAAELFADVLASPGRMLFWFTLVIVSVAVVVGSGVRRGIEAVSKFMMPALFILLLGLAGYACTVGDAGAAVAFLFAPDFSGLTAQGVLMAFGQCLFSLAVGTGAMLAYGAYLSPDTSIPGAAWTIGLADTAASLLAGMLIFPIVFSSGLDPAEGPGLIFVTLPIAFSEMPGGQVFAALFFLLVFFAAFTSCLGMMEPFVSWLEDRAGWNRRRAALLTAVVVFLLGLAAVFSFNLWKDFTPLDMIPPLQGRTVFSILDYVTSNLILPINALMIAVMAGWVDCQRAHARGYRHAFGCGLGDVAILPALPRAGGNSLRVCRQPFRVAPAIQRRVRALDSSFSASEGPRPGIVQGQTSMQMPQPTVWVK
jgi:NSS family neurotransmitter:Na+ symporter